ncbi:hypothetical protein NGM99_12580 [Mesorhizobium sp. RP14(2022)]|uniref:Uncharacterized protein n=1 Tax=Mesorhizobium liriopis TaxID=2953882 RepID=A0ABT1C724_9HYPH|nr:hypothetical protein [Mesorhizobium liriopis]MCO6050619.1 hypothetical protein [Mesorhizobium liriopis]
MNNQMAANSLAPKSVNGRQRPMPGQAYPCDVFAVAARVGVRLPPMTEARADRAPGQCFARKTLKWIGQTHGEPHLELVLRLIVESKGNATALEADIITAVSRVVLSGLVTVDGALFDAFDQLDLGEIRAWATVAARDCPKSAAIASVILWQLANPRQLLREAA